MFMFTRRILQGNEEYLYLIMIKLNSEKN